MSRPIYQRLIQLLRSLLGRGGSDDQPAPRAEQDTDQETGQTESESDANRTADDPDRPKGGDERDDQADRPDGDVEDGSSDGAGDEEEEADQDGDSSDEIDVDINWPPHPCVEWPAVTDDPEAVIDMQLFHERGSEASERACRMTAPHFEYVLEEAWGDRYRADVSVADEAVPEYINDRAGFKKWAAERSDESPAEHVNVYVDPGSGEEIDGTACCGWGYVSSGHLFEETSWGPESCVKRRRWGPVGYGISVIIHEGLHCIGLSHENSNDHLKSTVREYGRQHSPVMATSYVGIETDGWHLIELHPENDQTPDL
jgi:hypothetical protein